MQFKTYMIKNFIDDKGCKGSLARGIKSDGKNFPKRTAHDFYRRYFEKYKQADDGVLAAFEECFANWKEQENKCQKKKPLNKS